MAKTLFNRKDAAVVQYGLEHTLEEFVAKYSDTTATKEALTKAYNEINKAKTKSIIAVKSGDGNPNEPLTPVHYALGEDGEIEKVDTAKVPTRTKVSTPEKAKEENRKPGIVEEAKKPAKKAAKKPANQTAGGSAIKPAAVKEGAKVVGSKRDAIKALLAASPEIKNKDIKAAIIEMGFASCYDSEIANCKK